MSHIYQQASSALAASQSTGTAPQPIPEVPLRVSELEKNLGELHSVIDSLYGRLELVMQYPTPEGASDGEAISGQSPLGDKIMLLNGRTLHASSRLRDILARLEV